MTALERAARAAWRETAISGLVADPNDLQLAHAQRIAGAVLMELRKPGEAAVDAYFDKCRDMGFTAHVNATCAMETMIDAILNEEAA